MTIFQLLHFVFTDLPIILQLVILFGVALSGLGVTLYLQGVGDEQ